MKINCITDAIKLLGLRVGDEFILDGKNFSKYKFEVTENGVREVSNANINIPDVVYHMFIGEFGFTKVPWKPEVGDKYYYCNGLNSICEVQWVGGTFDLMNYYCGTYFKNKEAAFNNMGTVLKRLKDFYDGQEGATNNG